MDHATPDLPALLRRRVLPWETEPGTRPPHTCFQPPNSSRDQFPPRTCRTCHAQRAAAIFLGPHDFAAVSVFRLEGPPLASHAPTQAASGMAPPPRGSTFLFSLVA